MEFDAFTGGVDFGGLRTKNDIKILICYMLCTLDAPFSKEDVVQVLQEQALANYFEINDAFSSLEEKALAVSLENSAKAALTIIEQGVPEAANRFNGSHP